MKLRLDLKFDKGLLLAVLVLLALGVFVIYSGSAFQAEKLGRPSYFYALSHLERVLFAFGFLLIGLFIDHKAWLRLSHGLFLLGLFSLVVVVIIGVAAKGASRWLLVGGISMQPSEFVKIALFSLLSARLAALGDGVKDFKKGFVNPMVTMGIVTILLLLQPNFSMAMMVVGTTYILLFTAGTRLKYLFLSAIPFVVGAAVVAIAAPYRLVRIQAWLHPEEYLEKGGYQLYNALISLGHGGLFGTGIGQGTQKLGFLPESYKDVAFSLLGEELGFVGSLVVLLLFGFIIYRGFSIARNAKTRYAKLFAVSLTASLAFNVIFHVFVCTGLMPTTGQPLPFISYGGTNLLASLLSIGILLNISRPGTGSRIVEEPLKSTEYFARYI
ncbi:MAG: putative lipid II flippase FtsW [Fibrobacteraceae bacterium]|nr:putative lipid II flippase FtsW [Fibrobacteraceae bacterium]